ncbi:hypothetical protein C9374_010277 [Naegleria lovaniensis]|uniref:Uncharacterized protein n=1 Tax=Naegleria lovaniensis TaxID=51637 RepID=A0AA88GGT4_NAELO|nr:uncharacterized protein C9374_010277 [Naegleria lovaniensis]KAG2374903.1 hypothetical protein C9374_010277 [Naegleria lovaniensis]
MREVGIVFECFNCGTYFVNTVKLIDLADNRGKKGKDILTETYISVQKYYEQFNNRYQLCICPTCNELIYNVKYQDMLVSVDHPCILSLCRAFKFLQEEEQPPLSTMQKSYSNIGSSTDNSGDAFLATTSQSNSQPNDLIELFEQTSIQGNDYTKKEEKSKKQHSKKKEQVEDESLLNYDPDVGVPLFMDVSTGQTNKQKWELVFGVGPQRLELDSSRSGRLYMPSLKSLHLPHITTQLFKMKEEQSPKQLEEICNKISKLCLLPEPQLGEVIDQILIPNIPLFDNYDKVSKLLDHHLEEIDHRIELEQQEEALQLKAYSKKSLKDVLDTKK